jgi:hypothetical protein
MCVYAMRRRTSVIRRAMPLGKKRRQLLSPQIIKRIYNTDSSALRINLAPLFGTAREATNKFNCRHSRRPPIGALFVYVFKLRNTPGGTQAVRLREDDTKNT